MDGPPLRFAFYTVTFLPVHEGVGHVLDDLARALVLQGHAVTIHTASVPGRPLREELLGGATVVRYRSFPLPYYPQYRVAPFPLFRLLLSPRDHDVDVAHVHTPFSVGSAGFFAARARGVPIVGTFHTNFRGMQGSFPRNLATRIFFRLGSFYQDGLYWRCDRTTVGTPEAGRALVAAWDKPPRSAIMTVPLGVDVRRFRPGIKDPSWPQRLGARGAPLVTYLGRLTRDKGVHELLDALAGLPRTQPFLGVLGGTGVEEAALRRRVEREPGLRDRVRLVGPVEEEEKPALLAQSRIIVLPSRADTSSISTLEAMACGATCIVTDRGGPRTLVQEGRTGLLVDPERPEAIRSAVARVLADPAMADRLGVGAREYALAEGSIDRTARAFLAIYRSLRPEGGGPRPRVAGVGQPARTT